MENKLKKILSGIVEPSMNDHKEAARRLDNLTKPLGSLGRLEELAKRYAAIRGLENLSVKRKTIFTFAADHGVAEERVSAFPKEVTHQMVLNFLGGGAGVNVLARHEGIEVVVVDVGVDHDFATHSGLIIKKVGRGTNNMLKGPAMSRKEAIRSIEIGIDLAEEWIGKGTDIFGTGEMGIANTTPSSAIFSVFSGKKVEEVTGKGTGIDGPGYLNKVSVIKEAIRVNSPDVNDPIDVLAKVGGFEIGGIAGLIIGAAFGRRPVVVDGFISAAAALIAYKLEPKIGKYLFGSHLSVEAGHKVFFEMLDERPLLDLNMRLGEGTGAALGIGLLEASVKIMTEMASFDSAGISK